MYTEKEEIKLGSIWRILRRLKRENALLKRRVAAPEFENQERRVENSNLLRRSQNDFPVAPWEDSWENGQP